MFLESGYEGARVDDIVAAAGLSRGTFYVYFPSKRDAFLALGVNSESDGYDVLSVLAKAEALDRPELRTWVERYLVHFDDYGAFERMWREATARDPDLKAQGIRHETRFARALGSELQRHGLDVDGDLAMLGLALVSMIEGTWYLCRRSGLFSHDAIVDTLVGMIERMLASGGGR